MLNGRNQGKISTCYKQGQGIHFEERKASTHHKRRLVHHSTLIQYAVVF